MTPGFIKIEEIVTDTCHAIGDYLERNKMKFLRIAKRVYNDDLKMGSIRKPVRQFFNIDKSKNTIQMPCDFHRLSSVSYMDNLGQFHPLYRNERLHDDIVDIAAVKDCGCKCGGKLCNTIKNYESIVQDVQAELPSGQMQTFRTEYYKGVDGNGVLYEVRKFPQAVFNNGGWTDTVLTTEKRELCQLETENGCVKDCKENLEKVCGEYDYIENTTAKIISPATPAVAEIQLVELGDVGDVTTITITDTELGEIEIGTVTVEEGDTLSSFLDKLLGLFPAFGYTATQVFDTIKISTPSTGPLMNNNTISVTVTPAEGDFLLIDDDDFLLIDDDNKLEL